MFTGIIEEVGIVKTLEKSNNKGSIIIQAQKILEDSSQGDSIAVNGVCLTIAELLPGKFRADISSETLKKTNLSALRFGASVNLERALAIGQRLGGHIVQGHVDGTGKFLHSLAIGNSVMMRFLFPEDLSQYFVFKGSVAINGISLTIAKLERCELEVSIIPITFNQTNLSSLNKSDTVNIEVDIIGKYVQRLLEHKKIDSNLTAQDLITMGY